jgi:hypothetical protein
MQPDPPIEPPPSDRERIARLERSVWWLKVLVGVLLLIVIFPPIADAAGAVLFVVGVAGGTLVLIVGVIALLNWWYGGEKSQE